METTLIENEKDDEFINMVHSNQLDDLIIGFFPSYKNKFIAAVIFNQRIYSKKVVLYDLSKQNIYGKLLIEFDLHTLIYRKVKCIFSKDNQYLIILLRGGKKLEKFYQYNLATKSLNEYVMDFSSYFLLSWDLYSYERILLFEMKKQEFLYFCPKKNSMIIIDLSELIKQNYVLQFRFQKQFEIKSGNQTVLQFINLYSLPYGDTFMMQSFNSQQFLQFGQCKNIKDVEKRMITIFLINVKNCQRKIIQNLIFNFSAWYVKHIQNSQFMYVTACEKYYLLKAYSSKIIRKQSKFHYKKNFEIMEISNTSNGLYYFNILTGVQKSKAQDYYNIKDNQLNLNQYFKYLFDLYL